MTEFDQSQKEFWSENTNLRAYDHPVVEAFARQRVNFVRGLLDPSVQSCLEIGCGDGFGMYYMQEFGAVFGCDISRPMLRRNPLRPSVAEADIYRLPYADKSFDLVYCWEVLHHVKDVQSAIREMTRVAQMNGEGSSPGPGGRADSSTVTPDLGNGQNERSSGSTGWTRRSTRS